MAIPSQQIGWSQRAKLLWNIAKQLERLTQVAGNINVTPPTTTTTTTYNGLVTYRLSNANYADIQAACADSGKLDSPSDYTLVYMMGEPAPEKPFFLNPELTIYANDISFGNRVMKQVAPIAGTPQFVTFNNQAVFTLGNC